MTSSILSAALVLALAAPLQAQVSTVAASPLGATAIAAGSPRAAASPAGDEVRDPAPRLIEVRVAASGGVVAAGVPVPPGADIRWTVVPAAGVRVLGPLQGVLNAGDALALGALAVTFGLPRNQLAGNVPLGTVRLQRAGAVEMVELVTVLPPRRGVALEMELPDSVRPGDVVAGRLSVRNTGTGVDTIGLALLVDRGWRADGVPARVVLEPGEAHEAAIRLRVPTGAGLWEAAGIRLTASGLGGATFVARSLTTVPGAGVRRDRVLLPLNIFAGAAAPDMGALNALRSSFGLTAAGAVGERTHFDLVVQENELGPGAIATPATRSHALMRAQLRTPGWSATLGDAYTAAGLLPRFHAAGRGAAATWDGVRFDARAALLFPRVGWGLDSEQEVITAGAGVMTGAGRIGLALLHAERAGTGGAGAGTGRSAALQYRLVGNGHEVAAEAGWLDVNTDLAGAQDGAAGELTYRYTGAGGFLDAGIRRAPETALLGGGIVAEQSLRGGMHLGRAMAASAGVYSYRTTASDFVFFNDLGEQRVRVGPSAAGGQAALTWTGERNSAGLSAQLLERESPGVTDLRRTVSLHAGHSFGRLGLHAVAEVGEREQNQGEPAPVQRLRGTLTWSAAAGSLWASVEENNEGLPLAVALNGSLRVGPAEITTVLNTFRDSLALPTTSFSSSISVAVARNLAIRAATEYRPWATQQRSPWAVSIGVRRTFAVPLPISTGLERTGLVYDDRNANGRRDPGEPGLAGVIVQVGTVRVRTDVDGRFVAVASVADPVVVAQRSLATGTMVRPGHSLGASSHIEIPVIRTGDLRVQVVLDADGSTQAGAGLNVQLIDSDGRTREADADSSGIALFAALLPGPVTLRVQGPAPRPGAEGSVSEVSAVIEAGAVGKARIDVSHRPRPVRFLQNDG
jgi:hypothetical protein